MSHTIGSAKDLNAGRTEALQGLLRSLGHANSDDCSSDATLSADRLQKLSEKILGNGSLKSGDQPSQLLSEDGLPIVDISEPANEELQLSASSPPVPEQDLVPLFLLPPAERERRRRQRDRVLDLLEEEERLQQLQEEQDAEEERKDALRKRKESAKAELQQLKATRDLQKKMGRALVQHDKGMEGSGQHGAHSILPPASSIAKKSVSFVDVPVLEADKSDLETHQPDLGDVTLGRLGAQSRVPLVSPTEAQKYTMKMRVVERHPVTTPASSSAKSDADSDDESTSSATHLSPRLEDDSSGEDDKSLSDNDALSDEVPLEEVFDYDTAQHHREIAREYYKKRHAIGTETVKGMAAPSPDDHDRQQISKGQTTLSCFRADRMAAAYDKSRGSVSTPIGDSVLSTSRQKSLQNSVRLGKLEYNQLVGGESGESGSEDETVREVIEMLRAGNIQNVGPVFNPSPISNIPPPGYSDIVESQPTGTPTVVHGSRPSKFKLAREVAKKATSKDSHNEDNVQPHSTISNVVERKVPRSSPRQYFPVNKPSLRSQVKNSEQLPPMIIDSPSFPMAPTPSFSPTHPMTSGSPSPHRPHSDEHQPLIDAGLSLTQDSAIRSRAAKRNSLSVERPISKFMAERKGLTE